MKGAKIKIANAARALEIHQGQVNTAAHALGIAPRSLTRIVAANPELREMLDDIRDQFVDVAERGLRKKVSQDDLGAIIFTLRTLGQSRGYIQSPTILAPTQIVIREARDWRSAHVIEGSATDISAGDADGAVSDADIHILAPGTPETPDPAA